MDKDPERTVSDFLESLPGGIAGARVLAAVSGGADSVALLEILRALRGPLGFELAAVTIDHALRTDGSSQTDACFVERLCASHSPPVTCFRVNLAPGDVDREAGLRDGGIEDAARALRYRALSELADSWGARWVMTGHTRADQLETLLMRFFQGSSGAPLAGIRPVRDRLARPLLGLTRQALVSWLRTRQIPWREDPTNTDGKFLRNRVRNRLVPLLDELFPGWGDSVLSGAERTAHDDAFISGFSGIAWERTEGGLRAPRTEFDNAHPAVAYRALLKALETLSPGRRIPHGYLDRIVCEKKSSVVSGSRLRFEREGDFVFWGPDIVLNDKSGYLVYIDSPGVHETIFGRVTVSARGEGAYLGDDFGPWSLPLTLRSRMPGDGESATLKKTFAEWGVPETFRDRLPLVEQDGVIRAVYGRPFGYPDRFI